MSLVTKPDSCDAVASRARWLVWLLLGFASVALAEKTAELSDDFLEFLGNTEDSDDNWSDFSHDADVHADTSVSHAHQSSSASSSLSSKHSVDRARSNGNGR